VDGPAHCDWARENHKGLALASPLLSLNLSSSSCLLILNDKNGDIEQGCQGNQQELPFPLSSYIRKLMFPTASHQYLTQMQHHVSSRNRLMAISEPWHVTNPWRLH